MRVVEKLTPPGSKSGTPLPSTTYEYMKANMPSFLPMTNAETVSDKPITLSIEELKKHYAEGYNLRDSRKKRYYFDYNLRDSPAKKSKYSPAANKTRKVTFRSGKRALSPPSAAPSFSASDRSPTPLPKRPALKELSAATNKDGLRQRQDDPTQLYEGRLINEALGDDNLEESDEAALQDVLRMEDDLTEYLE